MSLSQAFYNLMDLCASIVKRMCTESKEHVKLVTQPVWERYIEKAEDIRHTLGNKEIYQKLYWMK